MHDDCTAMHSCAERRSASVQETHWRVVPVSGIDPANRWDGDQCMAEVHEHIHIAPTCQPVVIRVAVSLRQSIRMVVAIKVVTDKQLWLVASADAFVLKCSNSIVSIVRCRNACLVISS